MDKEVLEVLNFLESREIPSRRPSGIIVHVRLGDVYEDAFAKLRAHLSDPAYAMKPDHIKIEPRIVMPGPDRSDPEIWLQAWLNVASASNSTNRESADAWDDHCLVQYKKRFRT